MAGATRVAPFSSKRILAAPWFQKAAGNLVAEYIRFVWITGRFVIEPANIWDRFAEEQPVIATIWHGQHMLMPFVRRDPLRAKVLISRHRDGEINAIAAERLGLETIRGSGDHGTEFRRKGAVPAVMAMLATLRENCNIGLTADVPKVSRVVGLGIIMLARESGRPIFPVGIATRRRIQLNNWDRSCINLPFSRGALVVGEPIRVAEDADDGAMQNARTRLGAALDLVTARANALAGSHADEVARG
jgi:lysophospholipid acyltransferase (LPLAT)-like uncharacterized protein